MISIFGSILAYILGAYLTFRIWCWRFHPIRSSEAMIFRSGTNISVMKYYNYDSDYYFVAGWSPESNDPWYPIEVVVGICLVLWIPLSVIITIKYAFIVTFMGI